MKNHRLRAAALVLLVLGFFSAGALMSASTKLVASGRASAREDGVRYRRSRVRSGRELLMAFLVSSTCDASNFKGLPQTLTMLEDSIGRRASSEGLHFITVGVALDEDARVGLHFLQRYGPFDEVMSGGSWLNTGSVLLMVNPAPDQMALPSLVLYEHDVRANGRVLTVGANRVIARVVGIRDIAGFVKKVGSIRL